MDEREGCKKWVAYVSLSLSKKWRKGDQHLARRMIAVYDEGKGGRGVDADVLTRCLRSDPSPRGEASKVSMV